MWELIIEYTGVRVGVGWTWSWGWGWVAIGLGVGVRVRLFGRMRRLAGGVGVAM